MEPIIIREQLNIPDKDLDTLRNILLIGTSEYGLTNEILEIKNEEEIIKTYGKKGTIYEAYQTINEDMSDYNVSLFVLKPYGTHAYANFHVNTNNEIIENAIIFKSIYSNEIYNHVKIDISPISINISFPEQLNLSNKTYYYSDYKTVQKLIDKINKETSLGQNVILATSNVLDSIELDESFALINKNTSLSGGKSDLYLDNNLEKYNCLEVAYDLVKGLEIDYIVLSDVNYNDVIEEADTVQYEKNFYTQLHELCIEQLEFGNITLGVMSVDTTKYNSMEEAINEVIKIRDKYNGIKKYEELKFLMIVIFDYLFYDYKRLLKNPSLYVAYNISKNKVVTNIIDKPFSKSISLNNYLEKEQMKYLDDNGFMCFRHSPLYDAVVAANGITNYTYKALKDYKYLTTITMLQNIMPKIKRIFENYLGESIYELEKRRYIDDEINSLMNKEVKLRNLINQEFVIKYDLENLSIDYELMLQNMYMVEGIKYIGSLN